MMMIPMEEYKGYTISACHPGSTRTYSAATAGGVWFEGESVVEVQTLIDEAVAAVPEYEDAV